MSDGFTELIDEAVSFFAELRADNTKAFYEPRKTHYTERIKKPAELLGEIVAEDLGRRTGVALKPKVFRIHRDVRFSKDKTPYNTHLHLMWTEEAETAPAWFFGASPDYMILGTGAMYFKGPTLTQYRAFVDREGADLEASLTAAQTAVRAELSGWGPEPLKRVPKPYDPDHPQADLLKRKSLAVTAPFPEDWRSLGLIRSMMGLADGLMPLWRLLHREFV